MSKRLLAWAFALAVMGGCGNSKGTDGPIDLGWAEGQTWYLGATYRLNDVHTEVGTVGLDGADVQLGELWSDEVIWTYQVVEQGLTPSEGDILRQFAETPGGRLRDLDVVRAWVDPALNDPNETWTSAAPVVYLVFTSHRSRLAGVVSYTEDGDQRVERAWATRRLSRSWSPLSQSMLSAAPTYLAPWGVRVANSERKLENGHWLSTEKVDAETVDVVYDDEMGGGVVASRYEVGQPWPVWTVSDNVDIRLLDAHRLGGMRAQTAPEDYDFRAGLQSSLDIDAALELSDEMLAGETQEFGAPDDFQPWNGSWWPQSEGSLVFGYDGRSTLSDRIRSDIDPLKKTLDGLNETLRELEEGTPEYDEKLATYRETQDELIEILVDFYGGVLTDLDGGALTVADGELSHTDGWSYTIDDLSPMDKAGLALYLDGETWPNPFYISAWELLNHYSPAGGSWWGHCNGWAGAAILNFEPAEERVNTIGGHTFRWTTADQKGLLSETHYSTWSHFFGARYYEEGDDVADLSPAAFHRIVSFYIRDQQVPLVFDTDAREQVWNFPAYAASISVKEEGSAVSLINVNTADAATLDTLPGIGAVLSVRIVEYREDYGAFQSVDELREVRGIGPVTLSEIEPLVTVDPIERTFQVTAVVDFATDGVSETHVDGGVPGPHGFSKTYGYRLVTDADGLVLRGTWDDDENHPDFAWVPYGNGDTASGSENAYLNHNALVDVLGDDPSRL